MSGAPPSVQSRASEKAPLDLPTRLAVHKLRDRLRAVDALGRQIHAATMSDEDRRALCSQLEVARGALWSARMALDGMLRDA